MKNEIMFIQLLKNNKYLLFEYLKLKNIRYNVNVEETSIRMDSIDSDNFNGLSLSLESMSYYDFKTTEKGNVLDLLSRITNLSKILIIMEFKNIIQGNKIELQKVENDIYYEYEKKELLNYPKRLLDLYPVSISDLFLKDNIKEYTQILFDIRYDKETDRILIPVIFKDKLVGIIGRYNNKEVPKKTPKYYPILSYPKSEVLFGYDICKDNIIKKGSAILVESEKSVMKSTQIGLYNTLAVGGSNVSNSQIELLKELDVKRVFVCFDSDKEKDLLLKQIHKWFKDIDFDVYFTNNNNKLVNEKSCIFDMNWSKDKTLEYIKKYSTKIEKEN